MSHSTYNQVQGQLRRLKYPSASYSLLKRAEEMYNHYLDFNSNHDDVWAWVGNSATRLLALVSVASQRNGTSGARRLLDDIRYKRGF